MPTAAQRGAKAQEKRAQALGAAAVGDEGLAGLDLPALRTEAKRLLGVDYDHGWDHDKEALVENITQARADRRETEIRERAERRAGLRKAIAELAEEEGEGLVVGEPPEKGIVADA